MQITSLQSTRKGTRKGTRSKPQPQSLHAVQIADALLKMSTASTVAGLSEASLYRKAATDPTFPKLIKLGKRCTRIRAGDLTAWLTVQARA